MEDMTSFATESGIGIFEMGLDQRISVIDVCFQNLQHGESKMAGTLDTESHVFLSLVLRVLTKTKKNEKI